MWIPSGAARWPDHRRGSVADLTTRSLLSRRASRMGTASPTAACRMYRGRARPACHGGRGCWAGGQKSSYNARHAGVAQLVERRLPKPEVASSRLVARSTFHHRRYHLVGGHGVQVHGQHPPRSQPSTSRSVPGRGSLRISAPGAHLISPCFSGNACMQRGITCRCRRVRAVPVAGLLAAGLDPATRAGSASLRKPVRHPNHLQSQGWPMRPVPRMSCQKTKGPGAAPT